MKIDSTPGEDLPALPEPMAPRYVWTHTDGWLGGRDEKSFSIDYTAEQMRAYALEAALIERERCAKLCESKFLGLDPRDDTSNIACDACAAAIRAGNQR